MQRQLRTIRIIVSALFFVLLTASIAVAWISDSPLGELLRTMQLVPAILSGAAVWIVAWVVLTLTFGRVYCSSVCPVGTLQDIAVAGRRKADRNFRFRYAPPRIAVRIVVAAAVGFCLLVGAYAAVEVADPYGIYARAVNAIARPVAAGAGGLVVAVLILAAIVAAGWWRGRLLCNSLCPVGALLGYLSRTPVYRIDINTDLCVHCGRCQAVCKSQCINPADSTVDLSRCVMCMDCTAVCPNSAITLRRGRHRLSTPMMMPSAQPCLRPTATPTAPSAGQSSENDNSPKI